MEVKEIVQTIIREPVLEVHFRMDVDGDDVIRIKEFIIGEINDYGYEVFTENLNIFDSIVWSDDDETLNKSIVDVKTEIKIPQ